MGIQVYPAVFLSMGDKMGRVRIVRKGETRFLERKLCKELYSAADGWFWLI
jgi:hypothetical protein